jgi:hypothetical protein
MPNQKISELTAIVTVDTSLDVLPIVDTSANTTKKISPTALKTALALDNVNNTSDANKPVSTAQQDALNAKVTGNTAIVAATKTKITYDAKGLVTAGNILDAADMPMAIDAANIGAGVVSSTEFGYLDGVTSAIQTQLDSKQATLVSGTNIKTINSTSLLGSGDISISANPSGVAGAIQFSNGSAFASDATNLFWDDTNNRLGVGTNAPTSELTILKGGGTPYNIDNVVLQLKSNTINTEVLLLLGDNSNAVSLVYAGASFSQNQYIGFKGGSGNTILRQYNNDSIGIGATTSPSARVQVVGSGATSATTSLLVQNSAGSSALTITDDRLVVIGTTIQSDNFAIGQSNALLKGITQSGSRIVINYVNGGGARFSNSSSGVSTLIVGEVSENIVSFGGITSSFPALKRASNNLEVKNADDTFGAGLSVGAALNASAILQADSTTKGFLPPRMTTTERNAIASPAAGLMIYNTTTAKLNVYTTAWEAITSL